MVTYMYGIIVSIVMEIFEVVGRSWRLIKVDLVKLS